MNSIPQKHCSKCKKIMPATNEYFGSDKNMRLGFKSVCKQCEKEKAAQRRLKNGQKQYLRSDKEGYKYCSCCKMELPSTSEYFNKHSSAYLGLKTKCRKCEKAIRETPEYKSRKNALGRKHYAEDPMLREQFREYRKWFQENYPDKKRENGKRYYDKNKEKEYIRQHNKRARKRSLPTGFTLDQWHQCLEYWGMKCCVCGRQADFWHILAKEHWIALTDLRPDNPGTVVTNMLPMCHSIYGASGDVGCNNSKSNSDPIEWLYKRLGTRKATKKLKEINAYFEWVKANNHS